MTSRTVRPLAIRIAFAFLWIFVFSMPVEKAFQFPGLGSIGKVVGIVALGVGVLAIALEGRFRIPGPTQIWLAIFILWSAITTRWSIEPNLTVERAATYIQLFSLILLIWEFCTEERHVLSLMSAYVLGTLVPAGDTVQRFLLGHQTFYNRYATTGFDPNDLALTLALSLPMSYYLILRSKGPLCWIYRLQMIAAIGTTFLTASRGGTFCMIVALSLVLWTFPTLPMRNRIAIVVVSVMMAVAAVSLVPPTSWQRLGSAAAEVSGGTLNSRTILWKAGLDMFRDRPFGGIGAGAYPAASAKVMGRPWNFVAIAHNSYISIMVETGLIGLAIFAGLLIILYRSAARMPRITRSFWLTLLAVWSIGVCSLTWEYRKPTWLVFGLLAAHFAGIKSVSAAPIGIPARSKSYFTTAEAYS
jgi:O-antigen ligase